MVRIGLGAQRAWRLGALGTLALLGGLGCGSSEQTKAAGSASAVASSVPAPATATPAAPTLRVLVRGPSDMAVAGANGNGVVVGAATGLRLTAGKLSEQPALALGFENARWSERRLWGWDGDALALSGKRDPESLLQGDELMYFESKSIGSGQTVLRAWRGNGWVHVTAVEAPERHATIARFQGRLVGVIESGDGTDYSLRLLAGKTGFSPPSPGRLDQPKEETAAEATPKPETTAAAASANVPTPVEGSSCVARILPRAADGLGSGEFMVVGPVCPGDGALWVEHWAAGQRKSSYELLPQPSGHPELALAMTAAGSAAIAGIGTRYLVERKGGSWVAAEAPGSGPISELMASPAGRLWLVAGGKIFSRTGDDAWKELPLPAGKTASWVMPDDGDAPFVLAGNELLGPPDAGPAEVVELAGRATSLCTEPYVVVRKDIKRGKKYTEEADAVKKAGVAGAALLFGIRGMKGEDALEAKVPDMAGARTLAQALGKAEIICGAPRGVKTLE
jgi:hypothetical protein